MVGRAPKRKVAIMREGARLPTEHQEQIAFVKWFRLQFPRVLIFAIPNGGKRNIYTARKLKAEGVLPGIPDLFIPKWNLWIEMKRRKGGKVSKEQDEISEYLTFECGHDWILALGADHGRALVMEFYQEAEFNERN